MFLAADANNDTVEEMPVNSGTDSDLAKKPAQEPIAPTTWIRNAAVANIPLIAFLLIGCAWWKALSVTFGLLVGISLYWQLQSGIRGAVKTILSRTGHFAVAKSAAMWMLGVRALIYIIVLTIFLVAVMCMSKIDLIYILLGFVITQIAISASVLKADRSRYIG